MTTAKQIENVIAEAISIGHSLPITTCASMIRHTFTCKELSPESIDSIFVQDNIDIILAKFREITNGKT